MDIGYNWETFLGGITIISFQGTSTFRSSWFSSRLEMVSLDWNFSFIGRRLSLSGLGFGLVLFRIRAWLGLSGLGSVIGLSG